MNDLSNKLKNVIKGDVLSNNETLNTYSHDASIFEVKPKAVVFPKSVEDIKKLIKFVSENKKNDTSLSLTARSAGTDMGGGSINDSIIVDFTKYFNKFLGIKDNVAVTQPGVFYRDFEKETLKKNLIFPSYPASRELCAIGGIVNNNSGGEKSLAYGKTEDYVRKLKVVLSDGNEYTIEPLNKEQLDQKIKQNDPPAGEAGFEGKIYKQIYELITNNLELITSAKPQVSKNSAGYYLWNVWDPKTETFDLTKLFVGAQGTLGLVTEAEIGLVPVKKHAEMMILFLHDLDHLAEIINIVLPLKPDTFEAYDDNTLKLALRFFPEFANLLGTKSLIKTAFDFLPEFFMVLTGGLPKMVLQIDFQSDERSELDEKIEKLKVALKPLHPKIRIAKNEKEELKYWLIRRESFNLLRHKVHNLHTAPFIDDFAVKPEYLPEFLPKLNKIFQKYPKLMYTIAGHVGDGNFHIIPLMKLEEKSQRDIIPALGKEVYDLVLEYKGTITGEHNDGLIRTPYLRQMYGEKVYSLFKEVKTIFDPLDIFNPRKKVGATLEYSMSHIRTRF